MMRLSVATSGAMGPDVARPRYDRARWRSGIVHLGIGAFHRAHQAVYIDDVLALTGGDWRITGVSLRSGGVRDQLNPQNGLYTVHEHGANGTRARLIGAVAEVLVAPEDSAAIVAAIASPSTHIVTLTVTEKGYCRAGPAGRLDLTDPAIAQELAGSEPQTAVGFLAAGLTLRARTTRSPITLLSCDNLACNGVALSTVLFDFLERSAPALLDWAKQNVRTPSTMIDRIVPATTPEDLASVAERLGVIDAAAVKTEPFSQWVIEDDFAGPRPALERVGVQLVSDVHPFEVAKLRLLNGAHSTLAYLGLLLGHQTVDQAIADPYLRTCVDRLMRVEAAATLPPSTDLKVSAYADQLLDRFANASLRHQLSQIAMDGSQKLPQRLLETVNGCHDRGVDPASAMLGVAAWIVHIEKKGAGLNDPLAERLASIVQDNVDIGDRLSRLLDVDAIFGLVVNKPTFAEQLMRSLAAVRQLAA